MTGRRSAHRSLVPVVVLLPFLVSLAACGGDDDPQLHEPLVTSFTAEPESIVRGEEATLSWTTENALSIRLAGDDGGSVDVGEAGVEEGSVIVSPEATTTYVLTAEGEEGSEAATSEITLTVTEPDPPEVLSFEAEPTKIPAGGEALLSWQTRGGSSLRLTDDSGEEIDLEDVDAGNRVVQPAETTTYTLTVVGAAGEDSEEAVVTVRPLATILSFQADPDLAMIPGDDVTLSWETEGALEVALYRNEEEILRTDSEPNGSHTVTVDLLTEFTLEAAGHFDSEDEASLTVPVIPIIQSFEADGDLVRPGDEVTFTWITLGADLVRLTGPAGVDHEATGEDALSGSYTAAVTEEGTFTLVAESGALDDIATKDISLTQAPRIMSFAASPDEVTEGEAATFAWVVEGAQELSLEVEGMGEIDLGGLDVADDDIAITLPDPGEITATLTATNDAGHGDAQATTTVEVVSMPAIVSFSLMPPRVGTGESVELSWQTENAQEIRMEKDGTDIGVDGGMLSSSTTDTVDAPSSYALFASNRLGYEVESDALSVEVGAPEILSFGASTGHAASGQDVTFSWEVVGGNDLGLWLEDTAVCQAQDAGDIASGSCVVTAPQELGGYVYELRVANADGVDTDEVEIQVSDGPIITSFEVSGEIITLGDSFEISWVVTDDPSGQTPELTLEDDLGAEYEISGFDPNQGSANIEPDELGVRTYTFAASTEGTTAATADFDVAVVAAPVIASFEADPSSIDTEGGTITPESTLSWEVETSTELSLYELDGVGEPGTLLHSDSALDPAEVYAGELDVFPAETTTYRLIAANAAEEEVSVDVRVVVDGASIVFFTADPVEILAGESTTLEWETERADSVSLNPSEPSVTEITDDVSFVDISATGTHLSDITGYMTTERKQDVVFPAGFVFPYYGVDRTEMQVMIHSGLYFDMGTNGSYTRQEFPTGDHFSHASHPRMAAYWDDLEIRDTDQGVWWEHRTHADGREKIIVQWNVEYWSGGRNPSTLDFQIVLFETGEIEYRYGTMTATDHDIGTFASAGLQNDDGSEGVSLFHREEYPGGLEDRAWRFSFDVPETGTYDLSPTVSTTYSLTAHSTQGDDWASVDVIVHPAVGTPSPSSSPGEIQAGEQLEISWSVSDAHSVRVLDEDDDVLCERVGEPSDLQTGSCEVTAPAVPDTYTYTVVAQGALERDEQSAEIDVLIRPVFVLVDFQVEEHISSGDSALVSWTTIGAASGTLQRGSDIINIASEDLDDGDFTFMQIHSTSDVILTIEDGTGRSLSQTETIYVDAPRIHDFTVDGGSSTTVAAGETVTLEWDTTEGAERTLDPGAVAWEITGSTSFVDISTTGTAFNLPYSTSEAFDIDFDDLQPGFSFPYYGEERDFVRVHTFGSVSFQDEHGLSWSRGTFPGGSNVRSPQISVFWDDIRQKADDSGFYQFGSDTEGEYLRIQWNDFESWYGDHNPSTMTFQLVLRECGAFDFHYLEMDGPTDRVDGASASIGFDDDSGDNGYQFSYFEAVEGGLDGRAWRFETIDFSEDEGSAEVAVSETTTFEMCVSGSGFTECMEVTVVVISEGSLMVSELMPHSTAGLDGQWIEVHNTTLADIDLDGWVVVVDGGEHTVLESVFVEAGGAAVLGRSGDPADNGGYVPDYVYGADLELLATGSTIELEYEGLTIDSFTYDDVDWSVVEGVSLSLNPLFLTGDPSDNESPVHWCVPASEFGTEGQLGSPGEVNVLSDLSCQIMDLSYESNPSIAIPDNSPSGITDVQTVAEQCVVNEVDIDIDITHTFVGDLILRLTAPDGTEVTLHNRDGGTAEDLIGNYPDDPPHGIQHESLDAFIGVETQGDWALFVSDNASWDTGTLNSWTLNINCG